MPLRPKIEQKVNPARIFKIKEVINKKADQGEAILYWMQRDMRVNDNWALLYAQQLADEQNKPFAIVFNLVDNYLGPTYRQYSFMLDGLKEVKKTLDKKNIPFYLTKGSPANTIPQFIEKYNASILITDFNPLRISQEWKREVKEKIDIPFFEVDSHNICPARYVSNKQEYGARTIRSKIHNCLEDFMTEFPEIEKQQMKWGEKVPEIDFEELKRNLKVDKSVKEIDWLKAGETEAHRVLKDFIKNKLDEYDLKRNNPNFDVLSNLSPYIHFGHISAQRIALEVEKAKARKEAKKAFLEELVVRRELADNFCLYNPNSDTFEGFPNWAKESLNKHKNDIRPIIYSLEELEEAKTYDELWNASQIEMVKKGKMHGYMRMYWCKKILEWSKTPEEAIKIAIYLNDKYEIDGRDPNGYTGIAWSIGGVHDRAWPSRDIFGKVRYMSYAGCKAKFDVEKYILNIKNN